MILAAFSSCCCYEFWLPRPPAAAEAFAAAAAGPRMGKHRGEEKNNLFRQLLLPAAAAVKQLRKNHLPGGKHRASEGRASSKTTPKKCLTFRLKSSKNNIFRQLLLPSVACGCCSKTASKNHLPGGEHRASEGRASSKTTPKNCLTCRLKS